LKKDALLHIAIIDLFITAELKDNPGLRGRPFIIGGEGGEIKKGLVIAASSEALAIGVRTGQSMRKALKAAPAITALLPRYEAYETLSEQFFAILGETASIVESFGLDAAFIAVNLRGETPEGQEGVYSAAKKLAAVLQARLIKKLGLHTAIGIAPNKPLARLAGLRAKKDGIKAVTKNESSAFMKTLPISSLPEVDRDAEKRLKAINMGTVEELSKTPLLFFEKNFGRFRGKIIYESSRNLGPVEVRPFFEAGGIGDEVTFEEGAKEASLIKETLYMLTEGLTLRLKAEKRLCRAVSIKITFSNFECLVRTLELEEETDSFNTTWDGALRLLEDTPINGKVLLIGLKLHGLTKKG